MFLKKDQNRNKTITKNRNKLKSVKEIVIKLLSM